jgi:Receptor family ligand binding region
MKLNFPFPNAHHHVLFVILMWKQIENIFCVAQQPFETGHTLTNNNNNTNIDKTNSNNNSTIKNDTLTMSVPRSDIANGCGDRLACGDGGPLASEQGVVVVPTDANRQLPAKLATASLSETFDSNLFYVNANSSDGDLVTVLDASGANDSQSTDNYFHFIWSTNESIATSSLGDSGAAGDVSSTSLYFFDDDDDDVSVSEVMFNQTITTLMDDPNTATTAIWSAFASDYAPTTVAGLNRTLVAALNKSANAIQWPVKHAVIVEGHVILGGLMMVHSRDDRDDCGSIMAQGGIQALEAMLFTLDWINRNQLIPNVTIGAHILDDCDKDTYGLEMAVDFIKGE